MRIKFKDPVMELYYRRAGSQVAYWLSVFGYNVHDRSISNRFYLIYFSIFWGAWIMVMFFLVGYIFNIVLKTTGTLSLLRYNADFFTWIMIGWVVVQLWNVAVRSPFLFSEEDSFLLCQSPVSRRAVGLASFFMGWPMTFLIFAGIASAISITLVESGFQAGSSLLFIGHYLGASLRALAIILPLQMSLQATVWALGALRISPPINRQARIRRALRGSVFLIVFLLLGSFFIPNLRSFILLPLSLPIQAAFVQGQGMLSWLAGLGLSLVYLLIGLAFLSAFASRISLNQAARETRTHLAIQTARSLGSFDLANALIQQQHLETVHPVRILPAGKDSRVLVWKDALQSMRSIHLKHIFQWVLLVFLSIAMFAGNNWMVQLVTAGTWAVQAGALTTQRARKDFARWWLFRSLPIKIIDKVKADIALPVIGVTLLGWLALVVSRRPLVPSIAAGALLPLLTVCSALSSLHDIIQRMETRLLLTPGLAEENVPRPSTEGLLGLLVSVLVPFILLLWQFAHPDRFIAAPIAILLAAAITLLVVHSVKSAYRWIE